MQGSSPKILTITDPLVLYRSLVAGNKLRPDPCQHRLARDLQSIYHRLIEYEPAKHLQNRFESLISAVNDGSTKASHHKLAPDLLGNRSRLRWPNYGQGRAPKSTTQAATALVRQATSEEAAFEVNSPRGLLVHGEPGTGKSMLVDLLAECLPCQHKARWHYSTFMLSVLARLEEQRTLGLRAADVLPETTVTAEFSILRLARNMVIESPILFLDEFQMPDRASSKIMSELITSFFGLGGILIATSNRMPEQLARAAGSQFTRKKSYHRDAFVHADRDDQTHRGVMVDAGDARFLDVLRARCDFFDMGSSIDWRRQEGESSSIPDKSIVDDDSRRADQTDVSRNASKSQGEREMPRFYQCHVENNNCANLSSNDPRWLELEQIALRKGSQSHASFQSGNDSAPVWVQDSFQVYGRTIIAPRTQGCICKWTFDELCSQAFGYAEYISLAARYHTIIIERVPVLTTSLKNEARRFINLLDALYEARCRLMVSATIGPDEIFFPNSKKSEAIMQERTASQYEDNNDIHAETFAEIFQDQVAPFRPNTSSYAPTASRPAYASNHGRTSNSQLSAARSILADEDSDFGPLASSQSHFTPSNGSENQVSSTDPDFSDLTGLIGQDEKFAYRRACSRLWQMCSDGWWNREEPWWRPLDAKLRHWERKQEFADARPRKVETGMSSEAVVTSPFRTSREPPPKFSWTHAWGMIAWGRKAGVWGQGPAGLRHRHKN